MKRLLLFASLALFFQATFSLMVSAQTPGYISARDFAQSQGIALQWFPVQRILRLRKGNLTMDLVVDSVEAVVNGRPFSLPSPVKIVDGQVVVPAHSLINVFGTANQVSAPPTMPPGVQPPPPPPPPVNQVLPTPPAVAVQTQEEGIMLVTVRHSRRDDMTRVVLEFNGQVNYTTELEPERFKMRFTGCRNVVPTKRSNPVGRDIKNVTYNSGPNREGLVVTFDLFESSPPPLVETVNDPFRVVLSFYPPRITPVVATATATVTPPAQVSATASASTSVTTAAQPVKPPPGPAKIPEVKIDVPAATLARTGFLGRTIVIDPGHGGADHGVRFGSLPSEKEITLRISQLLGDRLREAGFKAHLLRNEDVTISPLDRRSLANKYGGDLYLSIHVGGSRDELLEGVACRVYDPAAGISFEAGASRVSETEAYREWLSASRHDLARFLATKIRDRFVQHLEVADRGVESAPLLPLKYIIYPAVLIEVGVLTSPREGAKLASPGYQDAIARSIANGVVDFFNGIKLNN